MIILGTMHIVIFKYIIIYTMSCIGDQNDRQGLLSPSPSWINQRALQNHDPMLVHM